ncbi:MAG: hypothetical protein AAFZ67_07025 [Planctomycetota bacterium]
MPARTASLVLSPRRGMLDSLCSDSGSPCRMWVNITAASALAGLAVVWAWLVEPVRGSLAEPLSAVLTIFQLTFVVAIALCGIAAIVVAFEHAVLSLAARLMHVAAAYPIAWRVSSLTTVAMAFGGGLTLAIVAGVQLSGLEGAVAAALPAGGVVAGLIACVRCMAAGLWATGMLRDAG